MSNETSALDQDDSTPDGELYVNGEYVCGEQEESAGVSDEKVLDEIERRGDFFYDAINTDEMGVLLKRAVSFPVCQLNDAKSHILFSDCVSKMNEVIAEIELHNERLKSESALVKRLFKLVKESMNEQ